jgi:hypothetical protein
MDDAKDFGSLVCNGCLVTSEPHPHHWLIGAILMLAGIGITGVSALQILAKNKR